MILSLTISLSFGKCMDQTVKISVKDSYINLESVRVISFLNLTGT